VTDSSANDKPLCRHHCQLSVTQLPWCPHPALCGKNSVSPPLVTLSTSFTLSFSQFVLMGFVIKPYVHTRTSVFTIWRMFVGSLEIPPALYNPVDSSVSGVGRDLDGWGLIPVCGRCSTVFKLGPTQPSTQWMHRTISLPIPAGHGA
jgi:hypothetical protein